MKQRVQVTILGQQYLIRSTKSFEEIQQVASFVDARIAEVLAAGATADTINAAVLAFLNVAGSYLELRKQVDEAQKISSRLHLLETKLSAALEVDGRLPSDL